MPTYDNGMASKNRGFTLLELLVSILILSLILNIYYSAFRLGSITWEVTADTIRDNSTTRFALAFMRNKIEHIYPIVWENGIKKFIAFQGEEDGVKFIAPAPQGREVNEYFEYYLALEEGDNNASIKLYYELHDPSQSEFKVDNDSPSRLIISGLSSVKFSYYGSKNRNMDEEWNENWEDVVSVYPTLVKISMSKSEDAESLQDLIVEIKSKIKL
jgi:prepilin-type N-terminal cleavage/methylation domain-containing protein